MVPQKWKTYIIAGGIDHSQSMSSEVSHRANLSTREGLRNTYCWGEVTHPCRQSQSCRWNEVSQNWDVGRQEFPQVVASPQCVKCSKCYSWMCVTCTCI